MPISIEIMRSLVIMLRGTDAVKLKVQIFFVVEEQLCPPDLYFGLFSKIHQLSFLYAVLSLRGFVSQSTLCSTVPTTKLQ